MPKPRKKSRPPKRAETPEEPAAEAITVAWIAAVTSVLLADAVTILAHFYGRSHPESKTAPVFEAIMLLTGCLLGLVALVILPVVWRTSRLKPPLGFVVFAALVSLAPVVVTIARLSFR
jgi:hypothetical protein